jgi:large subunit ribosomal protein L21
MYAVIKSGGKQHKVSEGEEILLEKLSLGEGDIIEFSEVLAVNKDGTLNVGKPLLEGAVVKGKIMNHLKTKKISVIKMKRRKDYRKKQGHRQNLTKVKIESISYGA